MCVCVCLIIYIWDGTRSCCVHGGQQDVDRLSIILGFVGLLSAVVKLHTSRGRESRERKERGRSVEEPSFDVSVCVCAVRWRPAHAYMSTDSKSSALNANLLFLHLFAPSSRPSVRLSLALAHFAKTSCSFCNSPRQAQPASQSREDTSP